MVGVTKSTVRKWETGYIKSMKIDKIALLAKALQVTPGFIMGLEPYPMDTVKGSTAGTSLEKPPILKAMDSDDIAALEAYQSLSPAAKKRVLEYMTLLNAAGKHKKCE